jgi:AraC family transcriptional activator of mtrCDE
MVKRRPKRSVPLRNNVARHIDTLISALDVKFVRLTECLVGPGFALELDEVPAPGLHYNIQGTGKGYVEGGSVIELKPHTLVLIPPKTRFRIEVPSPSGSRATVKTIDSISQTTGHGPINRLVASAGEPEIVLICGFFQARYGLSTDLFRSLRAPIVAAFSAKDLVHSRLREALDELVAQEVGSGTMSAALLKQVLVIIIRRSLTSSDVWREQFALLEDERIARAFAEMAATPSAPHSVETLARVAGLSRSMFMQRFAAVVGRPPMEILRDLRMKQAADCLRRQDLTVQEIASQTGYASHSSFVRAFRKAHGVDPRTFRTRSK